jgi:hypothetical protein
VKVIAIAQGFFEARRRVGDIFDLPERAMKKDKSGKPIPPEWVARVPEGDEEGMREYAEGEKLAAEYAQAMGNVAAQSPAQRESLRAKFKKMFGVGESDPAKAAHAASGQGASGGAVKAKQKRLNEALYGEEI